MANKMQNLPVSGSTTKKQRDPAKGPIKDPDENQGLIRPEDKPKKESFVDKLDKKYP